VSVADTELGIGPDEEPLAGIVARLRAERDGLRRAIRSRAVIEQAKGVLMARLRLTADEAFARLMDVSQHSNVKVVQVAATVVATVSPPPAESAGSDGSDGADGPVPGSARGAPAGEAPDGPAPGRRWQRRPNGLPAGQQTGLPAGLPVGLPAGLPLGDERDEPAAEHTRHVLTVARLQAAGSYEDIVDAMADTLPAPSSVVLLLTEADGALRLVAWRGLTPEVASQWVRIPPQVRIPLTDAVRRAAPIWLPDPAAIAEAYPILMSIGGERSGSVAAMPLVDGGRVIGALGLTWPDPAPARRAFVTALGEACGPAAARIGGSPGLPGTEEAWLRPMLDATLGSAAVLTPVRSGGQVVDFLFEALNERAAEEAERYGVRTEQDVLLSELPGPGRSVLLPFYRAVLADGLPRQLDELVRPTSSVLLRAVRLGERVVASWRTRAPGELLYDDLVATERLVGAATFRWRPSAGQWLCTPNLPALLGWPAGGPALTPSTAWRAVAEADWPAVRRAVVAVLRGTGPVTVGVRTRRGRWLRATLSRTPDGGLRGAVQDVTEVRAAQARKIARKHL
jgi:hypothetical protein